MLNTVQIWVFMKHNA